MQKRGNSEGSIRKRKDGSFEVWITGWKPICVRFLNTYMSYETYARVHFKPALSQAMAEGLILSNPALSLNLPRGTKP